MAVLLGRVVTILPLLLLITLYMGRRSIGELPIFDFLILLALGAVVGADIADPTIGHIHTAVAIILIGVLQKVVAKWKIRNRKLGNLITFEPVVVISDGKFIIKNLKKTHFSIDNILMMLRQKDVFDVNIVKLAVLEANGDLSVLRKGSKSPVVLEDLNIQNKQPDFALPVIVEGKIYEEVLADLQLDAIWIEKELQKLSITDVNKVFYAAVDNNKTLHVSLKTEAVDIPKIYH